MSRLSDAIESLRKAVGERPFILVVDACAPTAETYHLRIEGPANAAPYTLIGLLRQAQLSVEGSIGPAETDDDPDDPDSP